MLVLIGFILLRLCGVVPSDDLPPLAPAPSIYGPPAEPECKGDRNATFVKCPNACQATCDQPNEDGLCTDQCMPDGCVCKDGYLFNATGGICIRPEDCPGGAPACGVNETYVECKVPCPTRFCPVDDSGVMYACDAIYPCPGGCECKDGFKRISGTETCVLISDCPPVECTRPNEIWSRDAPSCLIERCDERGAICDFPYPGPPRCICQNGFFRNQDGICVPESECPPLGCEGDFRATFVECPSPCQPTCSEPDTDVKCIERCDEPGCVCNDEFLLNEPDGYCVSPYECPGGSPTCGPNKTYTTCKIFCSSKYCPEGEHEITYICDPVWPCPASGCVCKEGYLWLSDVDQTCVLSADCPPVNCTRPNEVWNPSPPICDFERCEDMFNDCSGSGSDRPRCVCQNGFYRNQSGVCIPAEQCPCPIPEECRPTCANPNPQNCDFLRSNQNVNGCNCQSGYILSKLGGECIKIEDCPTNLGCNGDLNAVIKQCPQPCPSTCKSPNAFLCRRACLYVGCECKPGYLFSDSTGQCVLPDNCPCGNPCGPNGYFTTCRQDCSYDYCPVDDSRDISFCDPPVGVNCLSGCACNLYYIRKSREDPTCIESSDCPPVECTRPNEIWNSCPSPCLAENCEDANRQPSVCNTLIRPVCQPRCVCRKNNFRNSSDICVPASQCPC